MRNAVPRLIPAMLLLLVLPACTLDLGAQPVVEVEEKSFNIQTKAELVLVTFDGSIDVRSWDRDEVAVTIERRAADVETARRLQVEATQDGDRIRVEVKTPERFTGIGASPSASLKVSLPRASDVEARSGDGSIRIEDVAGRLSLRTGDGSITALAVSGDLSAHTGDGSVRLDAIKGRVKVHTGDGSVTVGGIIEGLAATTGDGSVAVHARPGSLASDDWEITTGDGAVTLELPNAFAAELDAGTGDGRISVDGLQLAIADQSSERDRLRGRLGDGGRMIRVRSGDGSIRLRGQ